ncbi:DUF6397 family protein [Streptomyces sp. JJ66]|uniref:DUF6397 family protein n=1 Tax=Streptomyces sp. JJ66 TaxID=2803843 RepID=UPI00214BD868|nr:DUF6397 family protein [Streptomyces sp. JJ66]
MAPQRARQELKLSPREFALAVELGEVATVPAARVGGRRRVPLTELTRLGAEPGFPEALRERLRLVGVREGAALLGIGQPRFTRLARAGCFGPVRCAVNRYRRLAWLYLAAELEEFAAWQPGLLHGALPRTVRELLAEGVDWRPRLWRGRRVAQLLGEAQDPWAVAAVHAAVLPPDVLQETVPSVRERLALAARRPALTATRPGSPSGAALAGVLTARSTEEVHWHRMSLTLVLAQARRRPPRLPGDAEGAGPGSTVQRTEQALLHDGDDQVPRPVVDPPPRQPPATGRDG